MVKKLQTSLNLYHFVLMMISGQVTKSKKRGKKIELYLLEMIAIEIMNCC